MNKTVTEILEELQSNITKRQEEHSEDIKKYSNQLNDDISKIVELEAYVLSKRQTILFEIGQYGFRILTDQKHIDKKTKERFEYYSTQYNLKTNSTEKNILINSDLCDFIQKLKMYENHVGYLRECVKTLDQMMWAIKYKIEILGIGLE